MEIGAEGPRLELWTWYYGQGKMSGDPAREFTIILAQVASGNAAIDADDRTDLVAFAGLYVLVTATVGLVLMKESKRLGRRLFPIPRLTPEA